MNRRASTAIRNGVDACIFVIVVVAVVTYLGLGSAGFWEPIP